MNIQGKINKLIKGLNIYGYIYLVNREQFVSNKTGNVCTAYKLFHLMNVEDYNNMYPDDKKDPNKYSKVKLEILSTFKQQEILLKLVKFARDIKEYLNIDGIFNYNEDGSINGTTYNSKNTYRKLFKEV